MRDAKRMSRINSGICEKGRASKEFSGEGRQLRCGCGSLMARITSEGIELKCRRCKKIYLIPLAKGDCEKLCNGTLILNQKDQRPLSPESKKEEEDERDSEAGSKT